MLCYVMFAYVQSPEGFAAWTGDPMEVMLRRLEQLEKNVTELQGQMEKSLEKFRKAERKRMMRKEALNELIRRIAEVPARRVQTISTCIIICCCSLSAHLQCESLLFQSPRLSSVCLSRIRSRKLSEICAKFRHLYRKSESPSKNMTSDFAPEVA